MLNEDDSKNSNILKEEKAVMDKNIIFLNLYHLFVLYQIYLTPFQNAESIYHQDKSKYYILLQ